MLEALAMYSDELMELMLSEEEIPEDLIHKVVKQSAQTQDFTPVFMGSAYKNKGVQKLLDAVVRYLPSPLERSVSAKSWENPDEKVPAFARSKQAICWHGIQDRWRSVRSIDLYTRLSRNRAQRRNLLQST